MAIVFFDEEHKRDHRTPSQKRGFLDISGWLVRKGLAANQTSADLTLVVISALLIGLTVGVAQHSFGAPQAVSGQVPNPTIHQTNGAVPHH